MKACGGAVFPVLVNMAVDARDGSCRESEEAQQSSRTPDASQRMEEHNLHTKPHRVCRVDSVARPSFAMPDCANPFEL